VREQRGRTEKGGKGTLREGSGEKRREWKKTEKGRERGKGARGREGRAHQWLFPQPCTDSFYTAWCDVVSIVTKYVDPTSLVLTVNWHREFCDF